MTLTISSQSHVIFSFNNYMHFTQSQLHSEITRDVVAAAFRDHNRHTVNIGKF